LALLPVSASLDGMRGNAPALLLGVLCGLFASHAAAQKSESDLSPELRTRFAAGVRAESEGDCRGALEAYDDVAQIHSTPEIRLRIAGCEERVGDLVRAVASYRRALAEAQDAGQLDIAKQAQDAVSRLSPKIPRLTIRRLGDASVTLDGVPISADVLRGPIPVNPGRHRVVATLSGRLPIEVEVAIGESESKLVDLAPHAKRATDAGGSTTAPPPEESSGWRTAGWVGVGVGAAALATSGVFFVLKQNAASDLEERCGATGRACPPDSQDTIDRGRAYTVLSNVMFGVGLGLAVVGGLAIALSSPSGTAETRTAVGFDAAGQRLVFLSRF
jgi:hypothetical protein